ncbi:hypothetical protein F4680DRAFT_336005 [Xylaria scruposa]|nr:hypothetical protein F4680DRAFT_336005 [Xylaria scruposa]
MCMRDLRPGFGLSTYQLATCVVVEGLVTGCTAMTCLLACLFTEEQLSQKTGMGSFGTKGRASQHARLPKHGCWIPVSDNSGRALLLVVGGGGRSMVGWVQGAGRRECEREEENVGERWVWMLMWISIWMVPWMRLWSRVDENLLSLPLTLCTLVGALDE